MTRSRTLLAIVLCVIVGLPALLPFIQLLADPPAWSVWLEGGRLAALTSNTLLLIVGTLALSLPLGVFLAILLYRTDAPGRGPCRFLFMLALLVPLPFVVSGWQPVLNLVFARSDWSPWAQGLIAAITMHAITALPWVVLLVGTGLCWVERELEEDGLMLAGPTAVILHVTLPRAAASIGAAALWITLLTANEIIITDMMQVRTFAEEVYTQFVAPEPVSGGQGDPLARSLAAAMPGTFLLMVLVFLVSSRWERGLPAGAQTGAVHVFALGRWRLPAGVLLFLAVLAILGVPLVTLVGRAGLSGTAGTWSPADVFHRLTQALRTDGGLIGFSLLSSALAGALSATLALLLSWASRGEFAYQALVLVLLAFVWSIPGPVLGIGLKDTIHLVLDVTGSAMLADWLFDGPSVAPLIWMNVIRFLPLAVALLWLVVRLIPAELIDTARMEGAMPRQELSHVVWPLTRAVWLRAALAVAILSLGELSAGKLVATPGRPGYAQELFARMHYGVTPDLAAGCLLLMALVVAVAGIMRLAHLRR